MKKILIILLAVACLFGAVSCKDSLDKLYKLPEFNPKESEEAFVLSQIIFRYISDDFTLQSKEVTTVYKSLEDEEPYIDGKLIGNYSVEDGEPKYSFTFNGTFEDAKDLKNVSFDVEYVGDDFTIIDNSVKNLPDEIIITDFINFFQQPNIQVLPSEYDSLLNLESSGCVNPTYAKSSIGESVSVILEDEILVSAPLESDSDKPYEDYNGETITLLKGSKVTTEFTTERSDNFKNESFGVTPLTFLLERGKANDTFKINSSYKVDDVKKPIKATVRLMNHYENSTCVEGCCGGMMITIDYNGKKYLFTFY